MVFEASENKRSLIGSSQRAAVIMRCSMYFGRHLFSVIPSGLLKFATFSHCKISSQIPFQLLPAGPLTIPSFHLQKGNIAKPLHCSRSCNPLLSLRFPRHHPQKGAGCKPIHKIRFSITPDGACEVPRAFASTPPDHCDGDEVGSIFPSSASE